MKKVIFNNETKRFGFLFDGIRKIGNTLPLTNDEYVHFGLVGYIANYSDSNKCKYLTDYDWDKYYKLVRRLIYTYGEHADESLLTLIINLTLPRFENSHSKLHYYILRNPENAKELISETYDKVKDRPMYELTRSIGSGVSGIAIPGGFFNSSKDRIIKRSINGFDKLTLKFYDYCMNVGNRFLPKIYSYDNNSVEMQTLKICTPKCMKFIQELNQALQKREQNSKHNESRYIKDWITEISKVFEDLGIGLNIFELDLHPGNIGENDNGDIILFDPIAPVSGDNTNKVNAKYNKRLKKIFKL